MNILDRFSLKGKVALITGGAGLYGRQIVEALLQSGAKTYCASRNIENLVKLAEEMKIKGYELYPMQLDLASEESILKLKNDIEEKEGRVDVLVNNAVLRPVKSWLDDASRFRESMDVNSTGLFLITRAFGELMKKNKSGSIINIGSIQGMIGPDATLYKDLNMTGYIPDYFFHKGAMINFTRFVASYYGPDNIRCNCISPGGFQVETHDKTFVKRYSDRTFLGRMANDTDMMGMIVFLASDASLYVTGTNIPVDGGYTAK
jgi:NAD(P)-dependent dehydrogenase (short-subunit alcohol dehydrogenase family)